MDPLRQDFLHFGFRLNALNDPGRHEQWSFIGPLKGALNHSHMSALVKTVYRGIL